MRWSVYYVLAGFSCLRTSARVRTSTVCAHALRNDSPLWTEELMTLNIVHALEQDSDRRSGMIRRLAPKCFHSALQAFAGVSGTPIFDAFKSGDLQYARFVAQKKS